MTIELKNVSHQFGATEVLQDCCLTVQPGELVAIVGPSGCGKTTLLNIAVGVLQPTRGQVLIDDNDVTTLPIRERNIGYIMEDFALYPHLSVRGNLEYPLKVKRTPKSERKRRAEEIAQLLGIRHFLDRRPSQLSHGERQRVAIGRSLVRDDLVCLLADEPFANLDLLLSRKLRRDFKLLQRRSKLTCLFVTHSQSEAMALGDRVAVMRSGRIEQIGTPEEIYARPKNTFVASFYGDPPMNLLPTRIDETSLFVGKSLVGTIPQDHAPNSQSYILGIRAEDVALAETGECAVECVVEVEEAELPDWIYTVKVGDERLIVRTRARLPSRGQTTVKFSARNALLFDEATGERCSIKLATLPR